MQAGFGNQMGTESWEVVCDEHCIGGGCKYFGNNDAQLDRINVFYHGASGGGASGGKYVPRAVLFDLKSGQGTLQMAGHELCQNKYAGNNWAKGKYEKALN
jgi:tubulin beta